ncbi:MAG TPA: hypothetical protein VLD59_09235 [Steroidobacteraceae bacterium]|nr:hypothetical protein [Steroidobacteraceae bacterium]
MKLAVAVAALMPALAWAQDVASSLEERLRRMEDRQAIFGEHRDPCGLSLPYVVGGNGYVLYSSLLLDL